MESEGVPTEGRAGNDRLALRFDAHVAMLHTFYEWRHKIMTRFAVSIAAVILALRWAYSDDVRASALSPATVRGSLLGIGAVLSVAAAVLDAVNQRIIRNSYHQGTEVERLMGIGEYGLFQSLERMFRAPWMTYRLVLRVIYLGSATIFTTGLLAVIT